MNLLQRIDLVLNMIEMKNICKSFGDRIILDNISLTISHGDFFAITGKSGSGKSTFANILGLLDHNFSGEYTFNGDWISDLNKNKLADFRNKNIGFIFQLYNLINGYSMKENILLPIMYGRKRVNREHYINIIEKLDIAHLEPADVINLSGGEKQRVGIGRALINNPDILIADEPTGNLDAENKQKVFRILKQLNSEGTTIVMVTHDIELAEQCGKMIYLENGVFK